MLPVRLTTRMIRGGLTWWVTCRAGGACGLRTDTRCVSCRYPTGR